MTQKQTQELVLQPQSHRHTLRLNDEDNERFLNLLCESGLQNKSEFMRHRIFNMPFRIITEDASALSVYAELTKIQGQIRRIGSLYNQVVRSIHSHHSLQATRHLLGKLEGYTQELIRLQSEALSLTEAFHQRCSPR